MIFYKKEKTNSYFTYIITIGKRKFVRQYKRDNNKIHGYPRTIPIEKIMTLLSNNTDIYSPKLLKNRSKYIDQEFIDGKILNNDYDRVKMIDIVASYIISMNKIDISTIKKYISWNNNTEYLMFLINNLVKVKNTFSSYTNKILNELNINKNILDKLKNIELDDTRNLSLIHGDIHSGNMIEKDNHIYLIDWELATIGDIAYEVATHSILMNYSNEEEMILIEKLVFSLNMNKDTFINDINFYKLFEITRRIYLRINKIDKLNKNNESYDKELKEVYNYYNKLSKSFSLKKLQIDELNKIIKNSRGNNE